MKDPYTHAELNSILLTLQSEINTVEAERSDARPLPPMSEEEARNLLHALLNVAARRTLTSGECFFAGQVMACYRMGIQTATLGKPPGRYFVISEEDLGKLRK